MPKPKSNAKAKPKVALKNSGRPPNPIPATAKAKVKRTTKKVQIQMLPDATFVPNAMFERAWVAIDNATNATATLLGDWAV